MTGVQTCALPIYINYAPNGWSAYEMPGEDKPQLGRTGMPSAIQMTLQFKETSFLTKSSFRTQADVEKAKYGTWSMQK